MAAPATLRVTTLLPATAQSPRPSTRTLWYAVVEADACDRAKWRRIGQDESAHASDALVGRAPKRTDIRWNELASWGSASWERR